MGRDALSQALSAFLGDLSGAAPRLDLFAADLKIIENNKFSARGEGLWRSASKIGDYRIMAIDEEAGTAGFMGLVWQAEAASIVGIVLTVRDDLIARVEMIIGPGRFPGATGVDARTLGTTRPAFSQPLAAPDNVSRQDHVLAASGYYAAVNHSDPALAPLDRDGARIEAGTQITSNPAFRFEFYRGLDGQALPNFGEWTAREQFERGMWNADGVTDERYPVVDRKTGVVFAFTTYRPWHKRFEVEIEGAGRVGPITADRKVALNMLEAFKIGDGRIMEMESVWEITSGDFVPVASRFT